MYRPGSHRQIAGYVAQTQAQSTASAQVAACYGEGLPTLDYSEAQLIEASAGQISAVTTSLIHSGSTKIGTLPCRKIFISFAPKGLPVLFDRSSTERHAQYRDELRSLFRPERRHFLASKKQSAVVIDRTLCRTFPGFAAELRTAPKQ